MCAAKVLDLGRVQLADVFQLQAQAVAQRAFGAKFVEQCFSLVKGVRRNVLALEQVAKAALNFRFGKQGQLLGSYGTNGTDCVASFLVTASTIDFIGSAAACKSESGHNWKLRFAGLTGSFADELPSEPTRLCLLGGWSVTLTAG
jgi:hypothetical protein